MKAAIERLLVSVTARRKVEVDPAPLLVELLDGPGENGSWGSGSFPFWYRVSVRASVPFYEVGVGLPPDVVKKLRTVVKEVSLGLDPREVEPLTFRRLVEVLSQHSAEALATQGVRGRVREMSELAAYEAIGLSRMLALAKDDSVTEFCVDSDTSPVYLDHA